MSASSLPSTPTVSGAPGILEARGLIRGGRFVAGVTGEQFADETTTPLLRACRAG